MSDIEQRKVDHIVLCAEEDVEFNAKSTLLEQVELMHDSLPEVSFDQIDLKTLFLGRELAAPLLITGMTGGAARAKEINIALAMTAQKLGLAFGVGSQRAMLNDHELVNTYDVRKVAPDVPILGNIGAVQAAQSTTAQMAALVDAIDANALCIHLNPGQELIQPGGDRDFRGCVDAISRLVADLHVPVIVKETGCGLSERTLNKLKNTGAKWVDVSGAGGTTWVGVEALRTPEHERSVGEQFWNWGVPTAASIVFAKRAGYYVIGSGGLRSGLDAARALALGADIAGMALPWLRAAYDDGLDGALKFGNETLRSLRTALTLTGCRNMNEFRKAPKIIGPALKVWIGES